MSLAEIEAAVEALPLEEQRELVHFLLARLPGSGALQAESARKDLSEFGGSIRLHEDPLEWQHRTRADWR